MGIGSIGTALVTGGAGLFSSALQYRLNKRAAERDRGWKERMSNSQYQRSMADMRKAGLNPILAYQQGGAGTPSAGMEKPTDVGQVVSTALQAARLNKELEVMTADIGLKKSSTELNTVAAQKVVAETGVQKEEVKLRALLFKQAEATGNSVAGRNLWSLYRAGKITWDAVKESVKEWYRKGGQISRETRKKNEERRARIGKGNRFKYGKPKRGARWQYKKKQ